MTSRFTLPTINDVVGVNPALTDLSLGFKNDRFLWDQIARPKSSVNKTGTYASYTRDYWFRRQTGGKRAASGEYTQAQGYGITWPTFNCLERGFEKLLDDATRKANQTADDLAIVDVAYLTNLIQLELEKDVAAAAFITGVWGTSTTLALTDQWSDFDASDPIDKVEIAKRTIRRATGAKVNKMFIGAAAWEKLKEHPLLLDKYKHTQRGILTEELVAEALGVGQVIVGDSVENTAAEGATFAGADIWTDNCLLVVDNAPGLMTPTGALTFMWNEVGNVPWAIQSYRWEKGRGDVTRVLSHYDIKIVASALGYIFLDCVA